MKTRGDSQASRGCFFVGIVSLLLVLVAAPHARACTAFLQDGALLVGRNLDWNLDEGLLIANKKGISKRALLLDPSEKAAEWVSRYGSLTFNQYGREMPSGGMNEAGLVVETLWLDRTRNPAPDERPGLTSWVQYQLDNSRTVAEVAATDAKIRISPAMPMPLHFFVCDRMGQAAVVELLDGKLVCHSGDTLPRKLITNNTYEESLAYLKRHNGFGGAKTIAYGSRESLDRFVIAAERLQKYQPAAGSAVQYAFDTLAAVRQGSSTKWTVVYDLRKLEIHYKTDRCTDTRTVQLAGLDFNAQTPVRMVSINTPHTGVLNPHFFDYDADLNRWLIFYTVRHTPMIAALPDEALEMLARYPETTLSK